MCKDFIALDGVRASSIMQGFCPCRLVGVDDIEVAIDNRNMVGQSASELFDCLNASRKNRIIEDERCWLIGLRSGHLDLLGSQLRAVGSQLSSTSLLASNCFNVAFNSPIRTGLSK